MLLTTTEVNTKDANFCLIVAYRGESSKPGRFINGRWLAWRTRWDGNSTFPKYAKGLVGG